MAVYAAKKAVIYLSTTGSGTATAVLHLNAWTMNQSTDKIEVTSFADANKTYVQGLPDLQGSFKGFWDDAESKPFTGASSVDGVKMYLYPSSDAPSKFWSGPAWLDITMDVPVSGAVAISGAFAANGSWSKTF